MDFEELTIKIDELTNNQGTITKENWENLLADYRKEKKNIDYFSDLEKLLTQFIEKLEQNNINKNLLLTFIQATGSPEIIEKSKQEEDFLDSLDDFRLFLLNEANQEEEVIEIHQNYEDYGLKYLKGDKKFSSFSSVFTVAKVNNIRYDQKILAHDLDLKKFANYQQKEFEKIINNLSFPKEKEKNELFCLQIPGHLVTIYYDQLSKQKYILDNNGLTAEKFNVLQDAFKACGYLYKIVGYPKIDQNALENRLEILKKEHAEKFPQIPVEASLYCGPTALALIGYYLKNNRHLNWSDIQDPHFSIQEHIIYALQHKNQEGKMVRSTSLVELQEKMNPKNSTSIKYKT